MISEPISASRSLFPGVPESPYQEETQALLQSLQSHVHQGLTEEEARRRLQELGPNRYDGQKKTSWWEVVRNQFTSPVVWLLAVAALVSFLFQDWAEGIAILGVIVVNAVLGFFMEWQAIQSVQALRQMDQQVAKVIRNGRMQEIPAEQLTLGDVFFVEAGDLVPADARLLEVNQLEADESALTGESLPVAKITHPLPGQTALAERKNMLYKGTGVVKGNGRGLITGIGAETELGKITRLVESAEQSATPLEKKMSALTKRLIWITGGIAAVFLLVGLIQGRNWTVMVKTAIALAVAAIPEGLSIVATIALAYGMLRLARRNAIIRKLTAVETLGGTNIIFTDKTGTLTENRIHANTFLFGDAQLDIADASLADRSDFQWVTRVAVLCNNAEIEQQDGETKGVGDPLEIALLHMATTVKGDVEDIKKDYPREGEIPFDSDTKIMGTLHRTERGYWIAAKGAMESVLPRCTHFWLNNAVTELTGQPKEEWQQRAEALQAEGLRVLAFAFRESEAKPTDDWLHELVLAGIVGFLDPPRLEVSEALQACREAGIKVIMITGDHPATALHIAKRVGLVPESETLVVNGNDYPSFRLHGQAAQALLDASVFARVTPRQKLDAVDLYQQKGQVVAMTGDGINDAPALKKADIGIAMGLRGTQVAKETADMVLKDDSFTSIAAAIAQGRAIFRNIREFISFLFACNMSEVFITALYAFAGMPFVLLPLQILFINLITDVLPALALGLGKGSRHLMKEPPRNPEEPILSRRDWQSVVGSAAIITLCLAGSVMYGYWQLGWDAQTCNTVSVLSLALAQLWHVFNLPSRQTSFFRNEVTSNRFIWIALAACILIVLFFENWPFLRDILELRTLDANWWAIVLIISLLPLPSIQLCKRLFKIL